MKKYGKALLLILAVAMVFTTATGFGKSQVTLPATVVPANLDGFVISVPTVAEVDGMSVVSVEMMTQGTRKVLSTQPFDAAKVEAVKANLAVGSLVDYRLADGKVAVPADASKAFKMVLTKGATATTVTLTQFDTMKYGQELSSRNGVAGNMVAAGWVFAKTDKSITVGDGRLVTEDISGRLLPQASKRYEETYKIANDVAVYNISFDSANGDFRTSTVSDFSSIPVTESYDYKIMDRQAVYVVFDRNYRQVEAAKVTAIYYFTPMSKSDGKPVWDVPTQSTLLLGKGIDSVSNMPYEKINASGVSSHPYTRSTEPFEIVKDTFYFVGDNEVAVYLFNANMGTDNPNDDRLIVLDAGWPNSGYQYWKNIELVGYDPRKVTDIMLTHGHGDHYGTAVELIDMIENAGGKVNLYGTAEDTWGIKEDALGNPWNLKGALPDSEAFIRNRTIPYQYDSYMKYGNVEILVTPTPGHTAGTGSFVFRTNDPVSNKWISFGYMGGYGFNGLEKPNPAKNNLYLRLSFQLGLAWLQQMVDVDFVAPQHTNQYPMVEVYQALKAYNNDPANAFKQLTMLDAMTRNEFINFNEKRYAVATNALSDSQPNYQSIETFGPFKSGRENGLANVSAKILDSGKIIQGFDKNQNVNPKIPLLKEGIVIVKDSYVHDPSGYYVQFYIDVLDDYQGFIPGSGPVESYRPAAGAPEILRTQRLNSRTEAEAVLASIKQGGTYKINLTKASAIVVPADITQTFRTAG